MPALLVQPPLTGRIGEPPPRPHRAPVGDPSAPTVGAAQNRRRTAAPMPAPQARYTLDPDAMAWQVRGETDRRAADPDAPLVPAWLRAERDAWAGIDHWAEEEGASERSARDLAASEVGSAALAALVILTAWLAVTLAALGTIPAAVAHLLG